MEIRSITEIYNLCRVHVVDVPIAKDVNTLVQRLRWMAGSYVGRLDTKTTSLRSACLNTKVSQCHSMATALPTSLGVVDA
jgi:glutamate dehydrogenase/leucine dehydrogenase